MNDSDDCNDIKGSDINDSDLKEGICSPYGCDKFASTHTFERRTAHLTRAKR